MRILKPLKQGEKIIAVAPSRPVLYLRKDMKKSQGMLKKEGFNIVYGDNFSKKYFYSAGTVQQRADDLNKVFQDPEVRLILCATGGSSSNQLLEEIDFSYIEKHPKLFIGYSDITALLLAIYSQTGVPVFHGPDLAEYFHLNAAARECFRKILSGGVKKYIYPPKMKIIRSGRAKGILIGGNLTLVTSLLGTKYSPNYRNAVLFLEENGESPASVHFKLQQFKLTGNMKHLAGLVIGHLSEYEDKKYPEDYREVEDIILDVAGEYSFPIIQVDYFGHDIDNFLIFPIGAESEIDTGKFLFAVKNPVNKISHVF